MISSDSTAFCVRVSPFMSEAVTSSPVSGTSSCLKLANAQMYVAADVVSVNGLVEHLLDEDSLPEPASKDQLQNSATTTTSELKASSQKASSQSSHESINCDECLRQFPNIQSYMDHECSQLKMATVSTPPMPAGVTVTSDDEISEGESFDGKIVYNADGSAYIIEGGATVSDEMRSDDEDEPAEVSSEGSPLSTIFTPIANAFYINRSRTSVLRESDYSEKQPLTDAPVMHSYRVFDVRSGESTDNKDNVVVPTPPRSQHVPRRCLIAPPSVPTKPILMCFVCKLSFGIAKSFVAHAVSEHHMQLNVDESRMLGQQDASAIIQGLGRDKQPLMSFLEPITTGKEMNTENCEDSIGSEVGVESMRESSVGSECSSIHSATTSTSPQFVNTTQSFTPLANQLSFLSASQQSAPVQGIVIRAGCEDHPQGNITGLQCSKCEEAGVGRAITSSTSGALTHSRNSCKTLKCPRCNWHYKYQETLEIHMKEKHAEVEGTQCAYCLGGRPHPRLARGEAYGCGYKPYRCDVCNYSTTTKGNLSIHMQSDKHINNMQDLQSSSHSQGGATSSTPVITDTVTSVVVTPTSSVVLSSPVSVSSAVSSSALDAAKKTKTKPIWRCDVCNYETNVARNLRIHMTSEKHTHNMLVLQQNMKHMQRDMHFQLSQMAYLGATPPLESLLPPLPYPMDQQMFLQVDVPMDLTVQENGLECRDSNESEHLFECVVCNQYGTDSLDSLQLHMSADLGGGDETAGLTSCVDGAHSCHVCAYRTPLRANFQLHCKTDKHVQRARLARHCLQGGDTSRLQNFFGPTQAAQVMCTACAHSTTDVRKMHAHVADARHEACAALWRHLASEVAPSRRYYHCTLCNVSTRTRRALIQHAHSLAHARHESVYMLRAPDRDSLTPDSVFVVREHTEMDNIQFADDGASVKEVDGNGNEAKVISVETTRTEPLLPMKTEMPVATTDTQLESHMITHPSEPATKSSSSCAEVKDESRTPCVLCALCQTSCADRSELEKHLIDVHHVSEKGLQRLMALVELPAEEHDEGVEGDSACTPKHPSEGLNSGAQTEDMKLDEETQDNAFVSDHDEFRCQMCSLAFVTVDALYQHQDELGHLEMKETPRGPGYLCWKKGCNQYFRSAAALQVHFREIHAKRMEPVYRHNCTDCNQSFSTGDKLQQHAVTCRRDVCGKGLQSVEALPHHMMTTHDTITNSNPPIEDPTRVIPTPTNPDDTDSMATSAINKMDVDNGYVNTEGMAAEQTEGVMSEDTTAYKEQQFFEDYINSQAIAENSYADPLRKYKCHRCKVAFTKQGYLSAHNKTLMHRRGDKLNYPTEKYLDPNRPYKCDVCRESFTQKNILLVHYNSVSHLHRLKLQRAQSPAETEPTPVVDEFDEKKPYRCQLCHVAYSQNSTLEIHLRSVLHQTRVARDEATGNSAASTPAPSVNHSVASASQNNKRLLQEMLQQRKAAAVPQPVVPAAVPPTVVPTTAVPTPVPSVISDATPAITSTTNLTTPQQSPLISQALLQQSIFAAAASAQFQQQLQQQVHACNKCSSLFGSQEALQQHQLVHCTSAAVPVRPRSKPRIQRTLLENIGFECVMQFNEYTQSDTQTPPAAPVSPSSSDADKLPEMQLGECGECGKRFSSVWVLKAHEEEIHGSRLSLQCVEKYGNHFRQQYDEKQETEAPSPNDAPVEHQVAPPMPQVDPVVSQAAAAAALLQMPLFGMMPPLGMPLGMSMAPPLIPSSQMLMAMPGAEMFGLPPQVVDPASFIAAQQNLVVAQQQQQKRARTRITDDQLRILRAHFDLNSSPSEAQIAAMSERAALPPKVIKHWFRNTLFKERQRNKDSPYNFNVPPATTLNLEEYEKTGRIDDTPAPSTNQATPLHNTISTHTKTTPNFVLKTEPAETQNSCESESSKPRLEVTTPKSVSPSEMMQVSAFSKVMSPSTPVTSEVHQSPPSTGYLLGKRANRTRFNDYQIKVLQEYFDQNAYPKDDDLEHLSRLLNLGPRIIVVWFQNARQKARKTYENQPANNVVPVSVDESGNESRYSRTPGLNYQCKRCLTVFQRYYELIKHQKMYCFRDDTTEVPTTDYSCEKCNESFARFDLWREHQVSHHKPTAQQVVTAPTSVVPAVTTNKEFSFKPESAFAMLQSVAQQHPSTSGVKRKASHDELIEDEEEVELEGGEHIGDGTGDSLEGQPRDKRLRTTILPEQLDLLYVHYAADSNPSRKQLEAIARTVRLRKRVVQVWFQNTRARERKGQARAPQLICKRCPLCHALFRARSALESHLAAKHAEAAAGVNIDELPDAEPEAEGDGGATAALEANMKKLYEDSLRRYLDEITVNKTQKDMPEDSPLDLSRPGGSQVVRTLDDSFSETHSESTDAHSGPSSPSGSATSQPHHTPASAAKRYRTQMTEQQISIMKRIFCEYKTPTMAECEMLGQEISLAKRVVQVWFQNARAKEKKMATQPVKTVEPTECKLCNFPYTHKYTIQDHIFTKRHIQRLARVVHGEAEIDAEAARSNDDTPHLSQLHAMGLQAMRAPTHTNLQAAKPRSRPAADQLKPSSGSVKVKDEAKEGTASETSSVAMAPALTDASSRTGLAVPPPPMMNPFGSMPVMNPADMAAAASMFSLMYPGLGMMYPGMGLPMMPPPAAMMPGGATPGDGMMLYDASAFGTPLSLLQIPHDAIRDVQRKLCEPGCILARYTQDCKMLGQLRARVAPADFACAAESMLDVGYICKKCHMVYPGRDACLNHQRAVCYPGGSTDGSAILKLEQIQYECCACRVKFCTLQEYKAHCELSLHRHKITKYPVTTSGSTASTACGATGITATATVAPSASGSQRAMSDAEPNEQTPVEQTAGEKNIDGEVKMETD